MGRGLTRDDKNDNENEIPNSDSNKRSRPNENTFEWIYVFCMNDGDLAQYELNTFTHVSLITLLSKLSAHKKMKTKSNTDMEQIVRRNYQLAIIWNACMYSVPVQCAMYTVHFGVQLKVKCKPTHWIMSVYAELTETITRPPMQQD